MRQGLARYETNRVGSSQEGAQGRRRGLRGDGRKREDVGGEKLGLETEVEDLLPDTPGYADCWGRGM